MKEKLNNNIEQTNFGNEVEQTTGMNPEVVALSNELSTPTITKMDPTRLNLSSNEELSDNENDKNRQDFLKPNIIQSEGDRWGDVIRRKQEENAEFPL